MEEQENKILNLQQKSHEVLLKILNNIGIIGSILAAIADVIFVVIFVLGIKIEQKLSSVIIFAIVNTLIGVLINILLRYQGQKYAEIENESLCKRYYKKKIKEKKYMSMATWSILHSIKDVIIKGVSSVFCIFGIIYISIEGSKNPVQILMTFVTLLLFACFGLMNMNSSYCRYYNIQVPFMENELLKEQIILKENK